MLKATISSITKTDDLTLSTLEITEEDLRNKSCKITTPYRIDLTEDRWEIAVSQGEARIFGGVVLTNDYDETTGLYTYQLQGYQRWLNTKTYAVTDTDTLYEFIKKTCEELTQTSEKDGVTYPLAFKSYVLKEVEDYQTYPSVNEDNTVAKHDENETHPLNEQITVFYEDKTKGEILKSLTLGNNIACDLWCDEYNVLRIDPIDLNTWTNPDTIYLTTSDLSSYNFKNDITNVITNVMVKTSDIYKNHTLTEPVEYSAKDLGFSDLSYFFGSLNSIVNNTSSTNMTANEVEEAVTDTVENERLAREKISDGLRNLMSFDIEFDGVIPELHTNMFIWFELPQKHILSNYSNIVAGIDKTSTRGGEYVLNRFYVEKVDITYSESELKTKVTLNPFASNLSSYSKLYTDAVDAYLKANCETSGSSITGGFDKFGVSADGKQVMAIGKPSACADRSYSYANFYKRIFVNKCPSCGATELLWGWAWAGEGKAGGIFPQAIDGKSHRYIYGKYKSGAIESHIFCANCDADFSSISGQDHMSCGSKNYLTSVTGVEISSIEEARKLKNGEYANGSVNTSINTEATSVSTSSVGCNTEGSYNVGERVKQLANRLTSSTNADQIMRDCLKFRRGVINCNFYRYYSNFLCEPEQCLIRNPNGYQDPYCDGDGRGANCCDGTRLYFHMVAYKGVPTSDLVYRHISGHVYGRYKGQDCDWVKGGTWGIHWGSGGVLRESTFPNEPFSNGNELIKASNDYVEDNVPYQELDFDDMEHYLDIGRNPFKDLGARI